jgi:hypothetical protein
MNIVFMAIGALSLLGFGLLVLGFWRQWPGV